MAKELMIEAIVKAFREIEPVRPQSPACPRCGRDRCDICNSFSWINQYQCNSCQLRFLDIKFQKVLSNG